MNRELSILVAEDDYLISEEIARVLRGLMYSNITKASDGKEAVDLVCSTRPELMLKSEMLTVAATPIMASATRISRRVKPARALAPSRLRKRLVRATSSFPFCTAFAAGQTGRFA